jgi:hypothetical protein
LPPISFTLVIDDFGIKYVEKEHGVHLIASIKSTYKKLTEDWLGSLYYGITLEWDYIGRTVDVSMPGYIKKKLQEYKHLLLEKIQNCPHPPEPKKFGSDAQSPLMPDATPVLDAGGIKQIQQIVGSILYYAHAVNMTVLMALSSIAVEQTKAMEKTMGRCIQLLDYLASNSEAKVRYHASDMIMNIHSNASYLTKTKAHSRACRHFFHGMDAQEQRTHQTKWRILCKHNIIKIHGGISGGSRTWSSLPQLPRWNNFLTDIG